MASTAGCGLTEVVVVVDTELEGGSEVDQIVIEVTGPGGTMRTARAEIRSSADFPVSVGLTPGGDALSPLAVAVAARRNANLVVDNKVETAFADGKRKLLYFLLERACVDAGCTTGDYCIDGECDSEAYRVDPDTLEDFDGTLPKRIDAGPPPIDERCDAGAETCALSDRAAPSTGST